jgi:hypothetical protein
MAKKALKAVAPAVPLRLDLGCGKAKQAGWTGVDALKLDGVDIVADLRKKWPWASDSVDEVRCSHFLEHLTGPERVHFANELCRVLRKGAKATIAAPHWTHDCAYGDPTHQWPPLSGWTFLYWNKEWRKAQAPHADADHAPGMLSCDFDYVIAGSWDGWLEPRNMEFRTFAMQRYVNSTRDLIVTLTKR